MKKLFDMDKPVMRALSFLCDLLVLNLLTLLCSLPVITAGAAFTAMNDIAIHIARQEENYVVKPFFRSFAANWKQATILWLVFIVAEGFVYADFRAAAAYFPALRLPVTALGVVILAVAFYAFALLARYENTLTGTMKNAAILAIGYAPRTLLMLVCAAALWVSALVFYRLGVPLLFMFGFSLPCYINALLMKGVFRRLEE